MKGLIKQPVYPSICQFVSLVKNLEVGTFTGLVAVCGKNMTMKIIIIMYVHQVKIKAVQSFRFSVLLYLTLVAVVYLFDTVNNLETSGGD